MVLELEKEVSGLRHHVSVLSKRNHKLELRLGEVLVEGDRRGRKEEVAVPEEGVAKEEEETGVPDPVMVSHIVAFGDEDVVVLGVAGEVVAVSVEEAERGEDVVALVRLLGGFKKRRLDEDGGEFGGDRGFGGGESPTGSERVGGERGYLGPSFG